MSYQYDFYFWVSVAGAIVVKILLGENHSLKRSIATGLAGIWFAWTFTLPIVALVNWDSETYSVGVAGLLTLTGEGLARQLINLAEDSKFVKALARKLMGLPQVHSSEGDSSVPAKASGKGDKNAK